jgi:hypothetical protein
VPRLNSRARRHRRRRRDHDISARRRAIPDHVAVRATKESPSEDSSSAISDHRRERDAEVPAGEAMRSVGFRAVATLDGEGGRREGLMLAPPHSYPAESNEREDEAFPLDFGGYGVGNEARYVWNLGAAAGIRAEFRAQFSGPSKRRNSGLNSRIPNSGLNSIHPNGVGFVRFAGNQTLQGFNPHGNWVIPSCHPNPQLTPSIISTNPHRDFGLFGYSPGEYQHIRQN